MLIAYTVHVYCSYKVIPAKAAIALGSRPMEASILGSMDASAFGSSPAACSTFGSHILGSNMEEAAEVGVEVLGMEDGTEVLGDDVLLWSSLLALVLKEF